MVSRTVKRATKPAADKASRWTVRGVPARLQKAAGDAARVRGQTLGQWLCEVVETALVEAPDAPAAATGSWRDTVEARLARLEGLVVEPAGPGRTEVAAVAN